MISAGCVVVYMRAARLRVRANRTSLVCGVFLALTFLAFVSANKLTTAANAIVLQFTAPVFILILSALVFRQRFARADVDVYKRQDQHSSGQDHPADYTKSRL